MKQKSIGTIANVSIRITIAAFLAVLGISVCLLYLFLPQYQTEIVFITAVFGGLAAIYSAFYAGVSIRSNIRGELIRNSFQLIHYFHQIDLIRARVHCEKEFEFDHISPVQFCDKIASDQDLHLVIKELLSIFSDVSCAIQQEFADEQTLYMSLDTTLLSTFEICRPYIEEVRKQRKNPSIYVQFEKLAKSWMAGKYLNGGDINPSK